VVKAIQGKIHKIAMEMVAFLGPASIILLLMACENPSESVNKLYAFDSLLQSQALHLAHAKAVLKKEVEMGGHRQQSIAQPKDSIAWSNELGIFNQLSAINKPVNRSSYTVTQQQDSLSNLFMKVIRTNKNLPLKEVKLYYLNTPVNLRKVEGRLNERNSLYKSARVLTVFFNEVDNKIMLTSYSIQGGQHMIFGDTVQFDIRASVTIH
jgi:hypothetical protein